MLKRLRRYPKRQAGWSRSTNARGFEVVGADLRDGLGDLLTIGSDVLDWRAAGVAGDAGQAFDSGVSAVDGVEDDIVPIFAGADFEQDFIAAVRSGFEVGMATRMTRPSKPASLIRTLLPPPRTNSGRLRSRANAAASANSASVRTSQKNGRDRLFRGWYRGRAGRALGFWIAGEGTG